LKHFHHYIHFNVTIKTVFIQFKYLNGYLLAFLSFLQSNFEVTKCQTAAQSKTKHQIDDRLQLLPRFIISDCGIL